MALSGEGHLKWSLHLCEERVIPMPYYLLETGGLIFAVLGLIHAFYTLADIFRPRRLVPEDRFLIDAMRTCSLRLTRGGTTMWKAWVGFNFSHSLGAVIFGGLCVLLGALRLLPDAPGLTLLIPVLIGGLYLLLSLRYWFRIPSCFIAVATACFIGAWFLS
jgi:hypothetical protein